MKEELRFSNVSIFYAVKGGEICALKDFSYTFKKGKRYAIVGYSGSGKSSLVNTITGNLVFDGTIKIDNVDIEQIPIKDRNIAFVNQTFTLFPHMTIYDNIIFPLKNHKVDHEEADKRVIEFAKNLNILFLLSRKPKVISFGQAARVALARELIYQSDIMIFDEPLANLDTLTCNKTLKFIKKVASSYESTLIYVTHDIKEAINIADKILVLNDGKLIGDFSPLAFLHSENDIVKSLRKDIENEKDQVLAS